MDNILSSLLSFNILILCLGLATITFVIRKLVEYFVLNNPKMPGSKTSKLWTEIFLPLAPVINGLLFGIFVVDFPYPIGFEVLGGRILVGLSCGLLSGLVYKMIKGMLKPASDKPENT